MLGNLLRENPLEIYMIQVVEDGFLFQFKEALYQKILQSLGDTKARGLLDDTEVSIINGIVMLKISLPFVTFPNYSHRKINWEVIGYRAEQIQSLLWFFSVPFFEECTNKGSIPPEFCLSANPQLMIVETSYQKDADFHGCGMGVGFSQRICEILAKEYVEGKTVPECEEVAFNFYFGLSSRRKREFETHKKVYLKYGPSFNSINVSIRNEGVPHFIVPGNCACLGANPDEFKYDFEIYSHNLDTPLQQMAMLAGVCSFWGKVLKPLSVKC